MKSRGYVWSFIFLLIIARLYLMDAMPLLDTTEARYGEIARKMLISGDWVTLYFSDWSPFWGKPPLSTWLSAGSAYLFGLSELSLRLPSLILVYASAWLIYRLARNELNKDSSILTLVAFISCPLIYISSGAVMTDLALLFALTLFFYSVWQMQVTTADRERHFYFGCLALGLGMLAKGPLTLVLAMVPITLWALIIKADILSLRHTTILRGFLLFLIISSPWYILAEIRTPGFLDYFIVGEHILRYIDPGWAGDLYGQAHERPYGTIWIFLAVSVFPLPFVALWRIISQKFKLENFKWELYLWAWALWPPIFFTFAGNILATYVIPTVGPLALLIATLTRQVKQTRLLLFLCAQGILVASILVFTQLTGVFDARSQRQLINYLDEQNIEYEQVMYYPKIPFSAEFYSRGGIENNELSIPIGNTEQTKKNIFVIRDSESISNLMGERTNVEFLAEFGRYRIYIFRNEDA